MQQKATRKQKTNELDLQQVKAEILSQIKLEAEKTRQVIGRMILSAVEDLRSRKSCDYEKRGPSSSIRTKQVQAVIERLRQIGNDKTLLPSPLRVKEPEKWIHQACVDVWTFREGGYPTLGSLYVYCHRNSDRLLLLAGL